MVIKTLGHNMAAPHETHAAFAVLADLLADHIADPWPCGIDQNPRLMVIGLTIAGLGADLPNAILPLGGHHLVTRQDHCATLGRIAGIQRHKTAVFHPAI